MATNAPNEDEQPSATSIELDDGAAAPLEPDSVEETSDFDDGDSAIESLASSTASIRDDLIKEIKIHGRGYQGYMEAKYVLPMDEEERERLDFQHHIVWLSLDQKSHIAPVKHMNRVLDAGCGTGIWAMDFADSHPETEVIGVDLAPVQPHNVPPNLNFEIDDLEQDWTFSRKFDFIHSQMMSGAFKDWQRYINQCYEFLEPGGYFELQDLDIVISCDDGTMPTNSTIVRWHTYMHDGARKAGFPLDEISKIPQMMQNAGFVDIVVKPMKWPQNTWPKDKKAKEIGKWVSENFNWGAESMTLALFTHYLGWKIEEVQVFAAQFRADLRNRKMHCYWPFYVVYGRKPQ